MAIRATVRHVYRGAKMSLRRWLGVIVSAIATACGLVGGRLTSVQPRGPHQNKTVPNVSVRRIACVDGGSERQPGGNSQVSSGRAVIAFDKWLPIFWVVSGPKNDGPGTVTRVFDLGGGPESWLLRASWKSDPGTGQFQTEVTESRLPLVGMKITGRIGTGMPDALAELEETVKLPGWNANRVVSKVPLIHAERTAFFMALERNYACAAQALSSVR